MRPTTDGDRCGDRSISGSGTAGDHANGDRGRDQVRDRLRGQVGTGAPDAGTVSGVVRGTTPDCSIPGDWRRGDPQDRYEEGFDLVGFIQRLTPDWHADALCREFDSSLWFPGRGQRNDPALDICGRCAVRVECLDEALEDSSLDHGIRGGLTVAARQQRRKITHRGEGGGGCLLNPKIPVPGKGAWAQSPTIESPVFVTEGDAPGGDS